MKILHVITSLGVGGAEHLVVQIVQKHYEKGHDVDVCVFNGKESAFMEELKRTGCKIICLGDGYYSPKYILKLSRLIKKYDLVHSHNSSPQLFVAIANWRNGCHLVTTEHNTDNRKRHIPFLKILEKWMYGKYSKIICISEQAEACLRDYLGKKWLRNNRDNKIVTIVNGIDFYRFKNAKASIDKEKKIVVVMVAAFRPQKDHMTLLKAMKRLSDKYELWLIGEGELRNQIEQEVELLDINTRVRFWGNRSDVPELLQSASFVVLSSHWEGFGLAAVEGMAAGKPVIVSDVDGLKQVVDGYGVLFPHGDDLALAKEIQHLAEDKEYADMVAKRCQQRAAEFDISVMAEKYNQVYLELMNPQTNVEE
jgi:glycosyltransferase involved in cell wall biosynthesis